MRRITLFLTVAALLVAACTGDEVAGPAASPSSEPSPGASASASPEPADAKPEHLAVVGDFGTGGEDAYEVADAVRSWVEEVDAGALLTTGDNVYPDGAPEYHEAAWEVPYGWTEERDMKVVASLGNHDADYGYVWEVVDLLDMPGRWYRARVGPVDVFALDSNIADDAAQLEWIRKKIEASDAGWQIAVFHHPPYSCSRHGSDVGVRDLWVSDFEEAGVDLVLNGHEHSYQRFEKDDITYVVTGGGGANLYPIVGCRSDMPELLASDDEEHHYVQIEIKGPSLQGKAVTAEGKVLDSFSVNPRD